MLFNIQRGYVFALKHPTINNLRFSLVKVIMRLNCKMWS